MAPLRWGRRLLDETVDETVEETVEENPETDEQVADTQRPPDVRVVTDSTAYLPEDLVRTHRITVIPLQLVIGGKPRLEGEDIDSTGLAEALEKWTPVSTSRPSPGRLLETFEALAADGATEIVAVHLSSEMSGTYEASRLAAREATVPVHVVDSRLLGMGMGYAVLAAATAVENGADAAGAVEAARRRADATRGFFYVDTLEHLRRGGRIGAAQALIGSALAVKPLLEVRDGRIQPLEKVRTSSRALARLEDLAVASVPGAASGETAVDVTVHHLAARERAEQLANRLRERFPNLADLRVVEIGAVVGAHVGPGMIGVAVSPRIETGIGSGIGSGIETDSGTGTAIDAGTDTDVDTGIAAAGKDDASSSSD